MGLNLGLESLNRVNTVRFTADSLIRIHDLDTGIDTLSTALENYWDAAKNAMTIKKAIKQYGVTASLRSVVGNEGLQIAQAFSMEGFWQKTKEFLLKIWEKIKEWFNRFWGMFFSLKGKLEDAVKKLEGKQLAHDIEFDSYPVDDLSKAATTMMETIKTVKTTIDSSDKDTIKDVNIYSEDHGAGRDSVFNTIHYHYTNATNVVADAKKLIKIYVDTDKYKQTIKDMVDKAISLIKETKPSNSDDKDANEAYSTRLKNIKRGAALFRKDIKTVLSCAGAVAARLVSHIAVKKD